jgi:hypothetical protein
MRNRTCSDIADFRWFTVLSLSHPLRMMVGMKRAEIRAALAAEVQGFDPALVSAADATVAVGEFAEMERLAAAGKMLAAKRVADAATWKASGDRSPADWLARASGSSVGEAAGVLETAEQLRALPATEEAVRAGRLSPGQARAVAGAAVVDPGSEGRLLDLAGRTTFKGLRDEAAKARAAATSDAEREKRIHRERRLRTWCDADGAFNLAVRGPMAVGARILERLKPLEEQVFRVGRHAGARDTFEQRSFDALCDLLDVPRSDPGSPRPVPGSPATPRDPAPGRGRGSAPAEPGEAEGLTLLSPGDTTVPPNGMLGGSSAVTPDGTRSGTPAVPPREASEGPSPVPPKGGRSGSSCECGRPIPRAPSGANTKLIARFDAAALKRGHTVAGETCEIAGVGPVSIDTIRSLMPDAFLAAVVVDGVDVHTVAHLGRSPTAHQRTALEAVSIACSNLECNQTVGIEIDHRTEWAKVKRTFGPELDPLCRRCHALKTHHGHRLEPGKGRRRLLGPTERPPTLDGPPTDRDPGRTSAGREARPAAEPGSLPARYEGPPRRARAPDQPALL